MSFVHRVDELVEQQGNALTGKADHWERVLLGSVAKVINGFPFASSGFNTEEGEPVIRIRDVTSGTVGTLFRGDASEAPRAEYGDLVIGMDGDFNSRLWPGQSALINQRVCKVVPNEAYYSKAFLAYVIPGYLKLVNDHTSAITVKHLSSGTVNDLPLPLPPRNEQDRLVSKLDELFSRIDEGERALERVQKLVERYRQSVLKAAVTGELTRNWREKNQHQLESGETLLTRILKARRVAWEKAELDKMKAKGVTPANDKWKLKYEEPVAPETTDLPELPEGWVWASLNQFAAPVDRAIQSGPFGSNLLHSEFQSEGKLVIGIDNVRDGWFSPGSQNRISDEKFEQLKKYAARPKDFLITVMATVGRTCVLPEDIEPAIITKHVYRFTLDQDLVIPEFVNLCVLGSPSVRAQMFGNVRGQTRPGLNKSILTQFGFPLPSLEEQRQILDQSAELTSQISENRKGLVMQTRLSNALRHSVLQTAFCGGLVSQNAADEPASELLERIAAERSEAPAQPQRGRKSKTQEPA
jgi:type I restriction enzyme, S subunit